jgi:hypothetical protein
VAAQVLFDKEEKKKKTKKFAGDGCLNGLQQCGALLDWTDDSAFSLRRFADLAEHLWSCKDGHAQMYFSGPLLIR